MDPAYWHHRTVWHALNDDAETSVYWAYSADDELLYVGMARDVDERLSSHRREKPWWDDQVAYVRSLRYPNRAAAAAAERQAIGDGWPRMNRVYPGRLFPAMEF
jgi:excinuclease UvrABC nuclease subunit